MQANCIGILTIWSTLRALPPGYADHLLTMTKLAVTTTIVPDKGMSMDFQVIL